MNLSSLGKSPKSVPATQRNDPSAVGTLRHARVTRFLSTRYGRANHSITRAFIAPAGPVCAIRGSPDENYFVGVGLIVLLGSLTPQRVISAKFSNISFESFVIESPH